MRKARTIQSGYPPSWLARRLGDERERVQTIGEFRREQVVDQAMPLDPAATLELRRYDPDPIVRAPACARSRVSRMTVGLIENVEGARIERLRQPRDNSLLHGHVAHSRSAVPDPTYCGKESGLGICFGFCASGGGTFAGAEGLGACPIASAVIKVMAWI